MNKLFLLVPLAFSLAACEPADRKPNPPRDKNVVSDATDVQEQQIKQNRTDLSSGATKQNENEADRTITQELRRAILDNSNFSMKAKNITIATKNGVITLRGTVATTKERSDIAAKARGLKGVTTVENFLEVSNTK